MTSTKKVSPKLVPPEYVGRHAGEKFLLVMTGKTVSTHAHVIRGAMVGRITMTCNNVFLDSQYHMFTNRKKFCTHAAGVPVNSALLVGCYIAPWVVRKHAPGRRYLSVSYRGEYPVAQRGAISVDNGIVDVSPCDVGNVMLGVAMVMGASEILVAGMDGFSQYDNDGMHFEEDGDKTDYSIRLDRERCLWDILKIVKPTIITPTVYKDYYADFADSV